MSVTTILTFYLKCTQQTLINFVQMKRELRQEGMQTWTLILCKSLWKATCFQ